MKILEDIKSLEKEAYAFRRYLHTIPEDSGKEYKTSAFLKEKMKGFGYTLHELDGYTGFWVDLVVDPSFKFIGLRADIDALPMDDMTTDEYKSTHEGFAHNCGHDIHMSVLLTTALYFSKHKDRLKNNVRFIFQMAEEDMRVESAARMVELGCAQGLDEVYALHNDASLDTGKINIKEGVISSYGSAWTLEIKGESAHGSTPQKGKDSIREGAKLLEEMDYIVAKKTSPFSPAVFGAGIFHAGTIPNALADYALLRGTIRSMDEETDTILKASFNELENISRARGFDSKISFVGYPAIINHKEASKKLIAAAKECLNEDDINATCEPMTGSEDFSYMVNACKDKMGAFFFLGSGNSEKGICNYLHSNPYYVEESSILVGTNIFVNLLCEK